MDEHKEVGVIWFTISIFMIPTFVYLVVITYREWRNKVPVDVATFIIVTLWCIHGMIRSIEDVMHYLAHGAG